MSFSLLKAPPVSAPEVIRFTYAITQSEPVSGRNFAHSARFGKDAGGQTLGLREVATRSVFQVVGNDPSESITLSPGHMLICLR